MKKFIPLFILTACSSPSKFKQMSPCPDKPNCVSSLGSGEHFIESFKSSKPQELMTKIIKYLKSQKNVELMSSSTDYIHAVYKSSLFKFKDDVEFRIEENSVQIKSASRLGYSDMGVNRKRLEEIRENIK